MAIRRLAALVARPSQTILAPALATCGSTVLADDGLAVGERREKLRALW